MRTESTVKAELLKVRETRHAKGDSITVAEDREFGQRAKDLMQELSDVLTEGAKPCLTCGELPHGNHKQEARFKESTPGVSTQEVPDIYVVRCIGCEPTRTTLYDIPNADGSVQRTVQVAYPSSSGETVADAVDNWNRGKRITKKEIVTVAAEEITTSKVTA